MSFQFSVLILKLFNFFFQLQVLADEGGGIDPLPTRSRKRLASEHC